jgi:pyruvate dehydrogenase E2 component (dihydrolipoamide acetyltransferase)
MSDVIEVKVPDIGDFKDVPVIEVLVKPGDNVKAEDALVTLESDKATMEVPSPAAGVVKDVKIKVGDKVSHGSLVLTLEGADAAPAAADSAPAQEQQGDAAPGKAAPQAADSAKEGKEEPAREKRAQPEAASDQSAKPERAPEPVAGAAVDEGAFARAHASPSVRRFARELGVDLGRVHGTGPKERVLKEDVQAYVKGELARPRSAGFGLPPPPQVDFARFGPVTEQPLSRIRKLSGANLHRNWVTVPHVTQHDEADITELEAFRKSQGEEAREQGVRFTILAFLVKAVVVALKQHPEFNASLSADGENLIVKQYFHIGVAVDTPRGLVVPVLRDADKKGLIEIARELGDVSARMREGKIAPADLAGGCFSISSLGGIGGGHFTPIINAPEVAILGVGRSAMKPLWNGKAFVPRLMLPLSLAYDHRVIDGAQGARFISFLASVLSDIRRLVL